MQCSNAPRTMGPMGMGRVGVIGGVGAVVGLGGWGIF